MKRIKQFCDDDWREVLYGLGGEGRCHLRAEIGITRWCHLREELEAEGTADTKPELVMSLVCWFN